MAWQAGQLHIDEVIKRERVSNQKELKTKKDVFRRLFSGIWYRGWDSNPQAR